MKRWQDWMQEATFKGTRSSQPRSVLNCVLRFRLDERDPTITEAQANDVPFTPVWWWWNKDADEYIMTMWDTEAGRGDRAHVAEGFNIITPMRAIK